jgi:hypothetical protein
MFSFTPYNMRSGTLDTGTLVLCTAQYCSNSIQNTAPAVCEVKQFNAAAATLIRYITQTCGNYYELRLHTKVEHIILSALLFNKVRRSSI